MGSIPKIVSTPVKWASKELLHRTLLRFPGGEAKDPIACTYCPEMCRFSCPTAVASGNDAVTPRAKMSLLHQESRWPGRAAKGGELWTLYDCTGCGRCTSYCKYEVPVADFLFEARSEFPWTHAQGVLASLKDEEDPWGDLAAELGAKDLAEARLRRRARAGQVNECSEPKSVFFVGSQGESASLAWQGALIAPANDRLWDTVVSRLGKRPWLLAESVWMNRRLGRAEQVRVWHERALTKGSQIILPFAHGADCIDTGGEGIYSRLFPEEARQMAIDFWERDRTRAEGILAVSAQAAVHLRSVLGSSVPVLSFSELFEGLPEGEGL